MPELPEVETMRRGIAAIVGSRIERVWVPRSKLRPILISPSLRGRGSANGWARRTASRAIAAVGRAGKRVLVELDSGERIVIEPRMTGRVLLADPPDDEHLRLVIELSGGAAARLLFWDSRGLGVVRLLSAEEFAQQLGPEKLGPDALEIAATSLRVRLTKSRRAIKVALLDQRAVAGVGNIYASEILHRARIHPATPCNRLRPGDWGRIHARMREVLLEAIELQGSTLGDGMYLTATSQPGGFQEQLRVYQRAGEPCLQCGRGQIVRIVQAQRSSFFCPACQPPRPSSSHRAGG